MLSAFPLILAGLEDTELKMQIDIWKQLDVEVHFIHHSDYSETAKAVFPQMKDQGFIIHEPKDWKKIDKMPCISYCAGPALEQLDRIREYTDTFVFVNCMCWLFPKEKQRVKEGLITHELYQREPVMEKLFPELFKLNSKLVGHTVKPYFDTSAFTFAPDKAFDTFRFGRISREDTGKYHPETLGMLHAMVSPKLKEGIFLGFNDNIKKKIGELPSWIRGYKANGITQEQFYASVQAIIQPCDPNHTENLPRISFEAMATGTLLIVDNKGGFKDQIIDSKTGWLCNDTKEFVYKSSRAAFEPAECKRMVLDAYQHLRDNWGFEACKKGWSDYFKEIGVL